MKNKQEVKIKKQIKSNAGSMLFVIMLIAIIMILSSIGLYAWAKYMSELPGNTSAQVAKWHFELKPGMVNETRLENFAITRTDGYSHVASEKLAPGTFGVIPIEIDTTQTEVTMTYEVKVQLKNCPANIKFYADSGKTEQLERTKVTIEGEIYDLITISKYLSLDMVGEEPNKHTEVNDVHDETIYWEWPYQTAVVENGVENIIAGDLQDTQDQGKTVVMSITATGIQVTEKPRYLADMVRNGEVKIGDFVVYDATKGLTAEQKEEEGLGKYTAPKTATEAEIAAQTGTGCSSEQVFNVNEITSWKVLGINERGEVELLGITTNRLELIGQAGYNNGTEILEGISRIYGHGAGATGARAMKVEDIDKYTTFDKTTYTNNGFIYGASNTYTFNNGSYTGIKEGVVFEVESAEDENGNTTTQEITKGDRKTVQQTHYYYSISSNIKSGIPSSMFTAKSYWLASRCCSLYPDYCNFGLRHVLTGRVLSSNEFASNGKVVGDWGSVAVVVSLKSNIQVKGKNIMRMEIRCIRNIRSVVR